MIQKAYQGSQFDYIGLCSDKQLHVAHLWEKILIQ